MFCFPIKDLSSLKALVIVAIFFSYRDKSHVGIDTFKQSVLKLFVRCPEEFFELEKECR